MTQSRRHVVLTIAGLCGFILAFQNCSKVDFSEQPLQADALGGENSLTPPSTTPTPANCVDVSAPAFAPKLKWDWAQELMGMNNPAFPRFLQVMSSPVVGDLNGDRAPEVVFVSMSLNSADLFTVAAPFNPAQPPSWYVRNGVLRIARGDTGRTIASVGSEPLAPRGSQTPLLMDIDGDGKMEIFYIHYSIMKMIALNWDGSLRWIYNFPAAVSFGSTGLTGADVNGDGRGEIFAGRYLIGESATRVPSAVLTLPVNGGISGNLAMPLNPADPGKWTLVNSGGLFNPDGSVIKAFGANGDYFAAADVLKTVPGTEIIAAAAGHMKVLNGLTGDLIYDKDLSVYNDLLCTPTGGSGGGPMTVGDFDGNPADLEVAVASGRHLIILDVQGNLKYKSITQDCSSRATGLTSFDFNGDLKPEILYADEEYFRIYEVRNGQLAIIYKTPNPSGTLSEYPVVADITGSGESNILVISNNYYVDSLYMNTDELGDKEAARSITGVRAFEATVARTWMPTNPIWNQHSFHPDLVTDSGRFLAAPLIDNSLFRRNKQKGVFQSRCE